LITFAGKLYFVQKAKKSYGQHFLVNEATAESIGAFIDHLPEGANVVEVGPGRGMLTKYLLPKKINLKAVEADRDMITHLEKAYPAIEGKLILLDFLKVNISKLFDIEELVIIGNFPYNISSQIVFKMINSKHLVTEMVGMFQKEMADRIIAKPGGKDYSVISVLTQAYYHGSIVMKLGPGAFNPPPKVDSAVIHLIRNEKFELECNEKLFRMIVKGSFNQRRKMIRNTLKNLVKDPEILTDVYFNQRPEQLSVQEFINLTNKLENSIKDEFRNENNGSLEGGNEG
jgi:16S rRNA (adenine1518-N6/adenine1519-N6)-dimethyltransferase